MISQAPTMSSPNHAPAELLRARTLEEMLEVVPRLGECDSLGAVPALATYDRQAVGWLTSIFSWLGAVLAVAWGMSIVGGLLFLAGCGLSEWFGPTADGLIEGLGGMLLHLFISLAGIALFVSAFNHAGPRRVLADSTHKFHSRLQLRTRLLRASRSQLARNRSIVAGDWRRAVCQNCLSRFELYRVRFAYWRWLSFARCHGCQDDGACYARVRRIEGWLDGRMVASQEQVGDVVRVNMLHRLPPRSLPLPTEMDELIVADAGDEDVETLILVYRRAQPRPRLPRPGRLRFRLTEDSSVSQMSWRQLKQNFRFVSTALPRRS
jgi:hypothetical protein